MAGKKRVVILGHSPLPVENALKNFAPGTRTWHFAYSARDAECDVLVIGCRISNSYQSGIPAIKHETIQNIEYYSVSETVFSDLDWMQDTISKFQPDCIVGVNTFPASIVSNLNLEIPFWADLNGSVMVEAQAKANLYDDDSYLNHFFKMESKILDKADIFSAVSEAQGFAIIGELGIWGRLNKNTMGYRFIRVLPNTAEPQRFEHSKNVFRGKYIKNDDFVILYSGGYNTWTDITTMFHGIEKAMAQNPKIVFVSTGGQITGHDDITYKRFQQLIVNSQFKDRFHLFGWVPFEDLPNYYLESDLAINSDRYCYEAIIGARTRILDWIRVPLPYISTPLSEITRYMVKKGLAYSFEQGSARDLANKLVKLAESQDELKNMKKLLTKALAEEFTAEHIFREFREWLSNPQFSPDHNKITPLVSNDTAPLSSPTIDSTSIAEHIAIVFWPKVSKFLRILHLSRLEDKIHSFGVKIVSKKPPVYKASIHVLSIPDMSANEKYLIPIKIQNLGNCEWQNHKESVNAVNMSYIWKDKSGNSAHRFEERTPLPKNVKSGKIIITELMITAPPLAGDYVLDIDLVKENEFWFSDVGSESKKLDVQIKKKQKILHNFPKISVIVVTYNSTDYIEKCLDSILASNYPDLEIIVVDNASSDDTITKLDRFKNALKIIPNKENLGFGVGNNMGIQNSSGEILVMINPDAYVTKDAIKELVIPMLDDSRIVITGSKILYPNTTKIQSAGGILSQNALPQHLGYGQQDSPQFNYLRNVDYVTGAAMAIHRKLFQKTGLFNPLFFPAYFEETDKCIRAKKLGYKVVYVPKSIVYHHESTTLTVLSKKYLVTFHTNRFRFVYKNYGLFDYITKFLPFEIGWFVIYLRNTERRIVAKAHLKTIPFLFSIFIKNPPKII
jgi:GT2 family glycosyltransferase/glycosyltransferase involved in cell wall biosynthesis